MFVIVNRDFELNQHNHLNPLCHTAPLLCNNREKEDLNDPHCSAGWNQSPFRQVLPFCSHPGNAPGQLFQASTTRLLSERMETEPELPFQRSPGHKNCTYCIELKVKSDKKKFLKKPHLKCLLTLRFKMPFPHKLYFYPLPLIYTHWLIISDIGGVKCLHRAQRMLRYSAHPRQSVHPAAIREETK